MAKETNVDKLDDETPYYSTLRRWCDLTGMSMSGTYRALAAGHLIAIKCGGRTLIDTRHGLAWLASQPRAEFKLESPIKPRRSPSPKPA